MSVERMKRREPQRPESYRPTAGCSLSIDHVDQFRGFGQLTN